MARKKAPQLRNPQTSDFTYREKYDAVLRFNSKNILYLVLDTEAKTVSVLLKDNDEDRRFIGILDLTEQEDQ